MIMLFPCLCFLLMTRPLISSTAFPLANFTHTALLLLVLLASTFTDSFLRKRFPLKTPGLLMLAAVLFSWARSGAGPAAAGTLSASVCGLLLFWQASVMDAGRRDRLVSALLASLLPVLLLAGYQFFFGFNRLLEYFTLQGSVDNYALQQIRTGRVFLPFITPNALAGYVAMLIPLCLTRNFLSYRILALAACCALILTQSVGAIIGLALALAAASAITSGNNRGRMLTGAAALIALLAILALRWKLSAAHQMPLFSLGMKLDYWKETLAAIAREPLLGRGLAARTLGLSLYSHNAYLQVWAEQGLFGLAALLWFIFALYRRLVSARPPWQLMAATSVFLLHNLVDFTFFLPEVSLAWWAITGIAAGHSRQPA